MSIELPGWLEPFLNAYGIPWPDVNEDAFHNVQQPLRDFGRDLVAVSDAIESAVKDLESGNPSQTLTTIVRYCADIRRDFLDPIHGVCDDLAGPPCDIAYDAIVGVKVGLIGLVMGEVLSDVADILETAITLGADVALTTAEAIAVRDMVQQAIQMGEADVASQLQSMAGSYLDNFVNSLVNPFINSVEGSVEASLDAYLPRMVLGEAMAAVKIDESAAHRLHLSPEQLNHSVNAIWQSSNQLVQAAARLESKIDEIFSQPDPKTSHIQNLSQDMRITLKSVVQAIKSDLVGGIETLIQHVEKHFVTLLEDFAKAVEELDEDARRIAASERMTAVPEVVVLSAASTWIGASSLVDETSDRVDAVEADRVQVGEAADVGFAASVASQTDRVSAGTPPVSAGTPLVSTGSGVENLDVRADLRGPGVTEADKGLSLVEELKVPVSQDGPHLGMVQAPGSPVQAAGSHHGEHHAPNVGAAESHLAATGVQHLHGQRDSHKPTVTTASGATPGDEETAAPGGVSEPDSPPG